MNNPSFSAASLIPRLQKAAGRTLQSVIVRNAQIDGYVTPEIAISLAQDLDAAAQSLLHEEISGNESLCLEANILNDRFCDVLAAICSSRGGYVYPYISGIGYDGSERSYGSLHSCGAALFVTDTKQSIFAHYGRRLWLCARCGMAGESPLAIPLPVISITHNKAQIEYHGGSFSSISVAVVIEPVGCFHAQVLLRARVDAIQISKGIELDINRDLLVRGLSVIAVAMSFDCDFLVARQQIRPNRD